MLKSLAPQGLISGVSECSLLGQSFIMNPVKVFFDTSSKFFNKTCNSYVTLSACAFCHKDEVSVEFRYWVEAKLMFDDEAS